MQTLDKHENHTYSNTCGDCNSQPSKPDCICGQLKPRWEHIHCALREANKVKTLCKHSVTDPDYDCLECAEENMTNKTKPVASVSSSGGITIGASDVIRYEDTMNVNGHTIKVSKAVELGIKHELAIASQLKINLQSETGLLITFPIMMLMSQLQEKKVRQWGEGVKSSQALTMSLLITLIIIGVAYKGLLAILNR